MKKAYRLSIENPSRDICAKMSASQSNRSLNNPSERNNFHITNTITALLVVGSANTILASEINITNQSQIATINSFNSINQFSEKTSIIETDSLKKTK